MKYLYALLTILPLVLFSQDQPVIQFFGEVEEVKRLNSPYDENFIAIHPNGQEIVFTRRNHPGNIGERHNPGDIWISRFDTIWSSPKSTINVHPMKLVTPLGFVNDGQYFLYNTTTFDKGIFIGEVWLSTISDKFLQSARKLDINFFTNISEHQSGSISADGKHILFAMETNFSFGVEDIYVSHLEEGGSWSAPRNLGYRINTPFQEYTPFLAADGVTLFFASNGRNDGRGSFDLYVSQRIDESWQNWTEPVNLGDKVNTRGSETAFSFSPGANFGYFVSTTDSDGYGDIKRIRIQSDIEPIKEEVTPFVLREKEERTTYFSLIDKSTGESVEGELRLISDDVDTLISSGVQWVDFNFPNLTIETKADGYLSNVVQLTSTILENTDTISIEIDALSVGNTITLKNVLFHRGTANFVEGSETELDRVVAMMNDYPEIKIMIKGHTDNVGDPVLNLELSRERVYVVRDYLMDKGINFRRLQWKGYGGNQPLVPNDSEENRRLNRRVEFTIIEN